MGSATGEMWVPARGVKQACQVHITHQTPRSCCLALAWLQCITEMGLAGSATSAAVCRAAASPDRCAGSAGSSFRIRV